MSNLNKDHPSIRVHAPPGGHSNNIFGAPQFEQSAANKKKHTESDIFGYKSTNNESTTKPTVTVENSDESQTKPATIAGQYKQSQMKSSIFSDEPAAVTRPVSEKNRSNIFGNQEQDDANKAQNGGRQGLRDPNASRMGYNPINGESYGTKDENNKIETTPTTNNVADIPQKPVHTSVRVFHPPGGRSNGPLW